MKYKKKNKKTKDTVSWDLKCTRKKAAKYLAAFLLFMLLCTAVSRGIYAYRMPRVEIGQAASKSIFHTMYAEGSIEAAKETAVVLMEGIRIREICVKEGEKVEPDSALLYLDEPDLRNLTEVLNEKIAVAEEKAAALNRSSPADKSSVMEAAYALAHFKEQYAAYQQLLKNKGRIESGLDGYIIDIFVQAGGRTPDSAAMLLADCSDDSNKWNFKAALTKEQADAIKPGGTVNLQFQNGRIKEEGCLVSAVRRTEEGTYEAVVTVTETGLSLGETGTLELTSQSGQYACCVPRSAVYSDGSKDYVLLIRETDTILGTELSAVRRDVVILDQNEGTAALQEDSLGAEDLFVVYADRAVSSGSKVRLFEEDDKRE